MMPPNSFQQVVAADDLPARKALSELGSAPLPPGAELVAAASKHELRAAVYRFTGDTLKSWVHRFAAAFLRSRISRLRAPGGNAESSNRL
jgi:hypothetical protein